LCAVFLPRAAVSGWSDQSPIGDSNKNLAQGTSANQPTFVAVDQAFNQNSSSLSVGVQPFLSPSINFVASNSQNVVSGTWNASLPQPTTWIVVAYNANLGSTPSDQEILSGPNTPFQTVERVGGTTPSISLDTSTGSFTAPGPITWGPPPTALLAEFNDPNSKIYFNNFTTATASGSAGTDSTNSLRVGGQGTEFWDGNVAEVIAYNRILSAAEKARLRTYLNARYLLGIT
jgi:hypothetical protein